MRPVNLAAVDLNLLVVVDTVLRERSATLAAARLHLTQSAVSNALRRARALFGDPLVVRTGRGFMLTPYAEALAPRLQAVLEGVRGVLGDDTGFRPETTTRRFTIAGVDAVGTVVLPSLLPLFSARFPRAQIRMVTIDYAMRAGLERADVDLLIGVPPLIPPACEAETLFEDPMVVIVRAGHPHVGRHLSLATYARLPHAELGVLAEPADRVDRALAAHGLRRHIEVTVPYLAALPLLVAGSDRIATVGLSVARAFEGPLSLRILKPPLALPPDVIQQIWHRRWTEDPGSRLFRELVHSAARKLRAGERESSTRQP